MRTLTAAKVLLVGVVASLVSAGQARAQCFEAEAHAVTSAGDRVILTYHFGKITYKNLMCTSPDTALRARTLVNGRIAYTDWKKGPPAVLGSYIEYTADPIQTCSGQWSATTEYGTGSSSLFFLLASDDSNIVVASCSGGGGGGPGPCAAGFEDTSTWTLAGGGSKLADHQLGLGLSRFEERPEGVYLFEEWAMLGVGEDGMRMRLGSAADFQGRLEGAVEAFRPVGRRERRVLVVQAGNHPHNDRHIPQPKLVPVEVDMSHLEESYGAVKGEFWFRAEVAPTGEVDRMLVLESSVPVPQRYLHDAVRENLKLQHDTDKRHRVVVFGLARVTEGGLMSVKDAIVVTPQCCCSSDPEAPPCL